MRHFVQRKSGLLLLAAACALLATASPLWARMILRAYSNQDIAGVDDLGNRDIMLGGESSGKIFKDSTTGIILQINRGMVENELGHRIIFRDENLTMFDPETYEKLTSTSSYTLVFERTTKFEGTEDETGWGAIEVKVHDPKLAPAPIP